MELIQNLWTPEDQRLLGRLKKEIVAGHMLTRPYPPQRFYIKTDWSKDGIGSVLLQAYDSGESRKLESQ